jgi:hypothetical protein
LVPQPIPWPDWVQRVTHHSSGERAYHIFYQLLAAPEEAKAGFGLGGKTVKDFTYLTCDHGGTCHMLLFCSRMPQHTRGVAYTPNAACAQRSGPAVHAHTAGQLVVCEHACVLTARAFSRVTLL